MIRALCHAQLACGAMTLHVAGAHRARWSDGVLALGHLFLFDSGKASIHFFLGLSHSCGGDRHASANEEGAFALVYTFLLVIAGYRLLARTAVVDSVFVAFLNAVATGNTAAMVNGSVFIVDA